MGKVKAIDKGYFRERYTIRKVDNNDGMSKGRQLSMNVYFKTIYLY